MDVDALRILVTLLSFVIFIGIVTWAMSARNQAAFDEAQQLPFLDEPPVPRSEGSPWGGPNE